MTGIMAQSPGNRASAPACRARSNREVGQAGRRAVSAHEAVGGIDPCRLPTVGWLSCGNFSFSSPASRALPC